MDAFQPPISHFLVFDFANAAIDSAYENGERLESVFHGAFPDD